MRLGQHFLHIWCFHHNYCAQKRLFERIMSRHGDQDNLPLLTRVQERLER
jgi:hypothetical protein